MSSLRGLRVRLHGLKMRCKKRVPVLPLVQGAGPTCGEEGRLLADNQALRPSLPVGKGPADPRNLVDPKLEHGGHTKVMHGHSDDVLIGLLQFSEQRVGERKQFLLLRSAGLFRRIGGTNPFRSDWRNCRCIEVAVYDASIRVRSLPLSDERSG